ncbi:Transposase [Phytophthora megakarya]|uniref:Transposase n=1 Tax=Phytophthora megakarya TaxID=4795 RepID=A0A225W7T1_9STRA|nr:Transposase [Phytophthora megakarya]
MYVYDVQLGVISSVLGVSKRSLTRWYLRFNETGNVDKKASSEKSSKWGTVEDTFTRSNFHSVFMNEIAPYLNPWPLPRSIVIIDNDKIHMYQELHALVHATGALLFFLPPYSPDLNPIEVGFPFLKRSIQRHANMTFRESLRAGLKIAVHYCTKKRGEFVWPLRILL